MELLGSDNSEFPDVNFCPVPQNNNLDFYFAYGTVLGSENSSYHLLNYTENDNSRTFSKPTKAFNLENIVQACPVSFQTHRANKDYSNSVKN